MKKKNILRAAAVLCSAAMLAGCLSFSSAYAAESENLISNSDFESGLDGWQMYHHNDAGAELSSENGQLVLDISALGSVNYAVQLYYDNVPLTKDCHYRISLDIYSTEARYIEVLLQKASSPYNAYTCMSLNMTEEVQHYSHVFTMKDATDANAKLVFNSGNHGEEISAHTMYIDNVVVEQIDESELETYDPYYPPILTNQIGYKPDAEKIAVFRDITDETEFSVVNAESGETVHTGELYGKKEYADADESDYYGDFSSVTDEGTYYITSGELDASYTFTIAEDVYDKTMDSALRMLYLQRCGCEVIDETFGHAECHSSLATIRGTSEQIDASGGWHDAGDYGRYVVPAAKAAADLMLAYASNPTVFGDDTGIPESGNNVPDILDETRYELEWMLKMQAESGGVYHQVTTASLPGNIMPDKDSNELIVDPISTTATADFCAVMAMAYEHYSDIDKDFADSCLAAAERAWVFLEANPDLTYNETSDFEADTYTDSSDTDERFWAVCQLYHATKEDKYRNAIPVIKGTYYDRSLEWHAIGGYGIIALLTMEDIDTSMEAYTAAKNAAIFQADEYMMSVEATGYGTAVSTFSWGSNMTIANAGILLKTAYDVTGEEKYLSAAHTQLDYILGRNPNGMCYISGEGTVSPENPHHRPSSVVGQAMPGMLAGGVNSALADPAAEKYLADTPAAKCYIDDAGSYSTNEITIYWNSPLLYLFALTEDERQVQPEKIKGDVNADGIFSILDIVMLQKYLVNAGDITDAEAGDLCENGRLDVFDLCVMKKYFEEIYA